jgi:peptide/nickel transport system substrate-binding protein
LALLLLTVLLAGVAGCSKQEPATPEKEVEQTLYLAAELSGANINTKLEHPWVNRGNLIYKLLLYRSLFLPDNTLTGMRPDLAESYKVSDDSLIYTITMKDTITWHDGEPLTANDVVWSISTALKAAQVNSIYTGAFSAIEGAERWKSGAADSLSGITATGKVITIRLTRKVGNFLNLLGQFAILPKHRLENEDPLKLHNATFWEHPISCGMYMLQEYNPGNYATFVVYDGYYGTKPIITKIVVTYVSDEVAAAQSQQVDYMHTNSPAKIGVLRGLNYMTEFPVDIMFYRYFVMNLKDEKGIPNPKLDDPRIREALLYAIDRKTLTEQLYKGNAKVLNTGVPSALSVYWKDAETYDYTPDKAKQLLEEANFDFSKTLRIRYYYSDQTSIDLMTAISQYYNNVGIKTDVQKFQGDATTAIYQIREHDLVYKGLSSFGYEEWYGEYASDSSSFVRILGKDGVFDERVNALRAETDQSKRDQILIDLQRLEQRYMLKLPLFTVQSIYFINTDRVKLPDGVRFGNPWFNHDVKFEQWRIVK